MDVKWIVKTLTAAALIFSIAACQAKKDPVRGRAAAPQSDAGKSAQTNTQPKVNTNAPNTKAAAIPDVATATTAENTPAVCEGGDAGKITVKGMLVANDGTKDLLIPQIHVTQNGGKDLNGKTNEVSAKNKLKLSTLMNAIDAAALDQDKTYVNIGCGNLDVSEIGGLKSVDPKPILSSIIAVRAHKVFICGNQKMPLLVTSILADTLILREARIELSGRDGASLLINAVTLSLENDKVSSINVRGANSETKVAGTSSIAIAVGSEVQGTGTLEISSTGGSCKIVQPAP